MRDLAGGADPTWSPPRPPEERGLSDEGFDIPKGGWPDWMQDTRCYAVGSRWRLTRAAQIVASEHCVYPTLAPLIERYARGQERYALEAGTQLVLVETYDPAADESVGPLDMFTYYKSVDGWARRVYRIEDGPSTGIKVYLPADPIGRRFPPTSMWAHAAFELVDPAG